jgi:hypothetical protein
VPENPDCNSCKHVVQESRSGIPESGSDLQELEFRIPVPGIPAGIGSLGYRKGE